MGIPNTLSSSFGFSFSFPLFYVRFSRVPLDVFEFSPTGFEKLSCYVNTSQLG
jgi:hypothetical protein